MPTPYQKRLNKYIYRMAQDMKLRNMAESTIDSYTWQVDQFCKFFDSPPEKLGRDSAVPAVYDRTKKSFLEFL